MTTTAITKSLGVSPLNAQNAFRRCVIPRKDYLKYEGSSDTDTSFKNIEIAAKIDAEQNPERPDVKRRHGLGPGIAYNRLGPITLNGYTTYADYKVGLFFFDLYQACKFSGIDEPKLLINHAFQQPESQIIYYRDDYKRDLPISSELAAAFHRYLQSLVDKTSVEDISLSAKMTTSPGPPYTIKGKGFFSNDDVMFGVEEDFDDRFVNALRKDYFSVKQSWFDYIEELYYRQIDFKPENVTPSNFLDYYLNHVLICGDIGYRFNSIDGVINAEEIKRPQDHCYSKDRKFMYIEKDQVFWGTINNRKLTDLAIQLTNTPHGLGTNRKRIITRAGYVSNLPSMVISKLVTTSIEDSVNSFASLRPKVLQGYKEFLQHCNRRAGEFHFINGDRSNAESFVTTNFTQFLELIPPHWRSLYKAQTTVLVFGKSYYSFQGLSSGIAKTTELNWIMGTFEALHAIAKLVKEPVVKVAEMYFSSVLLDAPFFEIGDYCVKLFMPTDDIPLVLYGPRIDEVPEILGEGTGMMEWNCSYDSMITFGMEFTKFALQAASTSPISKFFYDEHPGFFAKSAFSLVAKYDNAPPELKTLLNNVYKKHFNCDINQFRAHANMYQAWLQALGVPLENIFDQYSPTNKIIYSKYVIDDPLNQTQVIDPKHYASVVQHFKNNFINKENLFKHGE